MSAGRKPGWGMSLKDIFDLSSSLSLFPSLSFIYHEGAALLCHIFPTITFYLSHSSEAF
jgi:hypothetical protein